MSPPLRPIGRRVTEEWHTGLAVDAAITVGFFWIAFVLGTLTTPLLPLLAWAYAAAVVIGPSRRLGPDAPGAGRRRRLGVYVGRWVILFPAALLAANAVVSRGFAALTRSPWAGELPVLGPVVDTWTVWDGTGLAVQVLALTGACVLFGLASALWRGLAWATDSESV